MRGGSKYNEFKMCRSADIFFVGIIAVCGASIQLCDWNKKVRDLEFIKIGIPILACIILMHRHCSDGCDENRLNVDKQEVITV